MKASIILLSALCLVGCSNGGHIQGIQTTHLSLASDVGEGKKYATKSKALASEGKEPSAPEPEEETPKLAEFLKGFTTASLPITLNDDAAKKLLSENGEVNPRYISYNYEKYVPEMRDEPRFSREVGKEFFFVGRVDSSSRYTAVVYAIMNTMRGEDGPWAFTIATYNKGGKVIDHLWAGQPDTKDPYRVAAINADGSLVAKDYKQTWEKDPTEYGYTDNKIVSSTLVRTAQYHFASDGRIVRDNVVVSMK